MSRTLPDQMQFSPLIVCADVGSVKSGNFGWCSSAGQVGTLPSTLADYIAISIDRGLPVALGFECPLFVPIADSEIDLTKARLGEGNRAWSAGAGSGALATGLAEVIWVLREIRRKVAKPVPAFVEWEAFAAVGAGLLVWEAFVSGIGKRANHVEDARAGADAFIAAMPDPSGSTAIVCNTDVHSLVGAAFLRTGWSNDLSLLSKPCLVIRA